MGRRNRTKEMGSWKPPEIQESQIRPKPEVGRPISKFRISDLRFTSSDSRFPGRPRQTQFSCLLNSGTLFTVCMKVSVAVTLALCLPLLPLALSQVSPAPDYISEER